MEHAYNQIKNVYDEFYKFLLVKHGMYPVKDTGIGYWGVSVSSEIFTLFQKIQLQNFSHMADLGSGDGKVVMIGSLFTHATGVEHDPWLFNVSEDIKGKLFNIPHINRASFINGNFMDHDLSKYDILFLNPDKVDRAFDRKLSGEFNGKVIVYGSLNHPSDLKKETSFDIDGTKITVYSSGKQN